MTLLSPQSLYAKVAAAEAETDRVRQRYKELAQQIEHSYARMGVEARVDSNGTIQTPKEQAGFDREIGRYIRMGRDFEKLLAEIKSNELLKATWDKLVMSMRLTQQ